MPVVIVPPPFRGPTQGVGRIEVPASSVREAVTTVEERYPGFEGLVFAADGAQHEFVRIFRNGELVEGNGALEATVGENDEIELVAAIAGG